MGVGQGGGGASRGRGRGPGRTLLEIPLSAATTASFVFSFFYLSLAVTERLCRMLRAVRHRVAALTASCSRAACCAPPCPAQVSLCLPDLKAAATQLWASYVRPLNGQPPTGVREDQESALFAAATSKAAALARAFEPGAAAAGVRGGGGSRGGGLGFMEGIDGGATAAELELPVLSKFLLVAGGCAGGARP
jgi:hypothetical protein